VLKVPLHPNHSIRSATCCWHCVDGVCETAETQDDCLRYVHRSLYTQISRFDTVSSANSVGSVFFFCYCLSRVSFDLTLLLDYLERHLASIQPASSSGFCEHFGKTQKMYHHIRIFNVAKITLQMWIYAVGWTPVTWRAIVTLTLLIFCHIIWINS